MTSLVRVFVSWIPIGVAITGVSLLAYMAVQQNYRQSLNDPQIQMAEDAARYLAKDYTPVAVVPKGEMVDIAKSLAPWIAVYDESGQSLESSGVLNDAPPQPPAGVFEYARGAIGDLTDVRRVPLGEKMAGENRVSWMPRSDVRSAIVVVHIPGNKGFVVAGRNMREVEERERQLGTMVMLGWLVTIIGSLMASFCAAYVVKKI